MQTACHRHPTPRRSIALLLLTALACAPQSGESDTASEGETTASTDTTETTDTSADTVAATDTDTDTGTEPEPEPEVAWPTLECDPLVPSYCAYPFPSNVYTQDDPTSPTGRRLALAQATLPLSTSGYLSDPGVWNQSDGFSPGMALLAHLPGATTLGLPDPTTIERSLMPDSPTVLINAETGEWVPHFSELDMSTGQSSRRTFMIRPVTRLADSTRYIAAIRGVVDETGTPLPASAAFAALRDNTPFADDPSIDTRRGLYADIFIRLADAGVERENLQLAWDFTTASRENNTARLVSIRDQALDIVGEAGPEYVIDEITTDYSEHIALQVEGRMTVPLYIDDPGPGGSMMLDSDGLPVQQGEAEYPFVVLIPYSAFDTVSAPLAYGHGLLGSKGQVKSGTFQKFANDYNFVLFAVDWVGMAEDDFIHIAGVLNDGELDRFATVVDRGQQGILNFMLATRMLNGDFANDPQLVYDGKQAQIATDEAFYFGNSQGGIFGATLMAVYTDVTRGLLGVPGQPYHLLLNRSVDFDPFFVILRIAYPDAIDLQMVLGLIQILWDRSEPNGFTPYIRTNMLPGTPSHEVLLQIAMGDHQVTTLGAHHMARSIGGVINLAPVNRSLWGIEEATAPHEGSGMIEYDFGLPPDPITNIPQTAGEDPHGKPRKLDSAQKSLNLFLREGKVDSFCDGPCDPE